MSNEIVRSVQKNLVTSEDTTLKYEIGKSLGKVAVGGTAMWAVAGILPVVTFPILLIVAFVASMALLIAG